MSGPAFRAVLALLFAAVAGGEGSTTINGSVADPSGAVVPGAKITVVEVDTHLSREAISNSEGFFVVSSLRPTRYSMTVEASGFRSYHQTGITLLADDSITIAVKLELGSTTE